jgi:hypothetical protein
VRTAFEYEVVQNTALAALAIHAATLQHHLAAAIPNGVPIPELMLVLPIALHQPSRVTVAGKVFEGSFYKAISENRTLVAGLQSRMQAMARQSFAAINLATAAGLVEVVRTERARPGMVPTRKTDPFKFSDDEIKSVIAAAKRVGHWLAAVRTETLCSVLNVRF